MLQCFLVSKYIQAPLKLIYKPGLDYWCCYVSKEHKMPVLPKSAVLAGLLVQGRASSSALCWKLRLVYASSVSITRKFHLLKPFIKHLNQAFGRFVGFACFAEAGKGSVLLQPGTALEKS